MPRTTRWIRGTCFISLVLCLPLMTACGESPGDPTQAPPTAARQTAATPSATEGQPPADSAGAARLIISQDVLPGVPAWRDSAQQSDAFRLTVCGVDLEPKEATSTARARFSQSPVGPFLEEYVRVHDDATAAEVLTDLTAALPGCRRYSAKGNLPSSPEAEFTIAAFPGAGMPKGVVAWRQRTVGDRPLTSDVAVFVRDGTLVAFVSYDLRGDADPAVLVAAVTRAHQLS